MLLLAPLAGPLVDRLPRVPVMVAVDLSHLVLAVWHGDVAVVYAVAFGSSAGAVFFVPAAGSLLPALVAEEELVTANSTPRASARSSTQAGALLLAAALAGATSGRLHHR